MVWCNALTEYYNTTNGTSLGCVYIYDGAIVRDSTSANCDNVTVIPNAKGFRLPTNNEWELAARYQDGKNWTPGDHVSGDKTGYCYNSGISIVASIIFGDYAWYDANSNNTTQPAGRRSANFLSLLDTSGNVWQFCYDCYPGQSGSGGLSGAEVGTGARMKCNWVP